MFGPKRKLGTLAHREIDPHITEQRLSDLKTSLEKLKKIVRPHAIKEVMRLSHDGDFSENAAYQTAKGKLRGINNKILEFEQRIKRAIVIKQHNSDTVQLGQKVTLDIDGKIETFTLLGSYETNPTKGIISHNSPIGTSIIGRTVGETIVIKLKNKTIQCRIVAINNQK